ncbi:MAG TPA: c-type cytochrome [Solirubrobacteraceae bacterium]|jgi:ubiquinol-cytochrome c reductase cytochrome c subunit|nr:c-type cytochrome [Solirubrobacteraceae bacterium]
MTAPSRQTACSWLARAAAVLTLVGLAGGVTTALAASQNGIVRPSSEPSTPSLELGRQLFSANCASCHGIAGEGISRPRIGAGVVPGAGPPLQGVGALAADFYLRTGFMPLAGIHDEPANHPVQFTPTEIASMTAFVASLGKGPGILHPEVRRGNVSRGFQLFTEDCAGCHQSLGRGGYVTGARVPPLQGIDASEIAEAVRIGPYLMPRFPASQISESQLASIVRYVLTTNKPDNRGGWSIGNLGPIPEGMVAWLAALLLGVSCLAVSRRLRS